MNNLIIIGGGNSIRSFPTLFDDIVGQDIMAINFAYRFIGNIPKFLFSIDRCFWNRNVDSINLLEKAGCELLNSKREFDTAKKIGEINDKKLFCGSQKLSGIAALDYATRFLNYSDIYLFGFDFGFIDGKSHFYDGIDHSGIGKSRAYYDSDGTPLEAINDFDYFKDYDIKIVGESNIKSFDKISYNGFKEGIK